MSWWDRAKENVHKKFKEVAVDLTGPMTSSKFLTEGKLTPEEFVQAGDLLVYKCKTWTWQGGDPAKAVSYLPPDKQYLVTKKVPCYMRASTLEKCALDYSNQEVSVEGDDGWVETHVGRSQTEDEIEEIPTEISSSNTSSSSAAKKEDNKKSKEEEEDDDDEPCDMETFNEDNLEEEEDPGTLQKGSSTASGSSASASSASSSSSSSSSSSGADDTIVRTRTYDMTITYDPYYATPKVWLFGYDESGQELKPEEVFQDISQDHAQKTVTLDKHPHQPGEVAHAYIHPCRHSEVMKKLIERQVESGRTPRVDQYLFLFLKFLSAVIPTIEYDYTVEFNI
jgi:ubiquitin-like-conjugating enzyme ATG3